MLSYYSGTKYIYKNIFTKHRFLSNKKQIVSNDDRGNRIHVSRLQVEFKSKLKRENVLLFLRFPIIRTGIHN